MHFHFSLTRPTRSDIPQLLTLYAQKDNGFLPMPDGDELDEAIELNRIFVIKGKNSEIFAAGAVFMVGNGCEADPEDYIPIYELSGSFVTSATGGLTPFSAQQILTAVRVLNIAASDPDQACVMSTVVAANIRSCKNLTDFGLEKSNDDHTWLDFLRRSWTERTKDSISNYLAGTHTVRAAVKCRYFLKSGRLVRRHASHEGLEEFEFDLTRLGGALQILIDDLPHVPNIGWCSTFPKFRASVRAPHLRF